jgi:LysM repeat protein
MDTISRDNNTSYLPIVGGIAVVLAIALSIGALVKASGVRTDLDVEKAALEDRVTAVETTANGAANTANKASQTIAGYNDSFKQVGADLTALNAKIDTLAKDFQDSRKSKVAAPGAKDKEKSDTPVGKDQYKIKAGDTSGTKIATENGVSLKALMDANPSVNWNKLQIGQVINLPAPK